MKRDSILIGDCIAEMSLLPELSVDMVFADPPYNLQLQSALHRPDRSLVAAVDAEWDKFDDFASYDAFSRAWLQAARRLLKKDGTLWVIGTYHNIFRLGSLLQDLGFWILNDVIWCKSNPMPNFRGRRFTNAHETLIWVAKHKESRYIFNYAAMKSANDQLQMRSDWSIPLCAGAERLKKGVGKLHPTQKPEALLHRILLASTNPGDLILDPFFGTGTSGAVARRLGRNFIGIERDLDYASAAQKRIDNIVQAPPHALCVNENKRNAQRIPFGVLIEQGLIGPGETLFDAHRRFCAKVRADGSLISNRLCGSIHQVAAAIQGLPSCNGWSFWHVERQGEILSIDALRSALRNAQNKIQYR